MEKKDAVEEKFGEETYSYSQSWGMQKDTFSARELIAGWFKAEKNTHLFYFR